ncbi:replication initiator protein [Coconut foliar decay alphasatellite 3]|uniref:Replication initiator protein n=1 Tax=Coconut foliar decay alphasatellite 3 TaxID=2161876 RepID=A0A2R4N9A8_9VIRU|nr:replication initiator protein [Coconut foliar decay alphasatellite 3]AVX29424.1 replication initiator protein [Coconut foliar decay alphasatellite 3]
MAMVSRRWCFTLNYSEEDERTRLLSLFSEEELHYAIVGDEVAPSTGQKHLQGYLNFRKVLRLGALKKKYSDKAHWEIAKGTDEENRVYCSKEHKVFELGSPVVVGSNKRKLAEAIERSPERMRLEQPEIFHRYASAKKMIQFKEQYDHPVFDRTWQIKLREAISEAPDDRSIIWVYGPDGNEGKSTFAKSLIKQDWFYTRGGKKENILFSYIDEGSEKNIVFDIPRCNQDYLNYDVIEALKDRVIESTKYKPVKIIELCNIHVVVMANFLPDYMKISEDRIKIIRCY